MLKIVKCLFLIRRCAIQNINTALSHTKPYNRKIRVSHKAGLVTGLQQISISTGLQQTSMVSGYHRHGVRLPQTSMVSGLPQTNMVTGLPQTSMVTGLPQTSMVRGLPIGMVIGLTQTSMVNGLNPVFFKVSASLANVSCGQSQHLNLYTAQCLFIGSTLSLTLVSSCRKVVIGL